MKPLNGSVNNIAQACAHSSDAAEWGELLSRCTPLVAVAVGRVARLWVAAPASSMVDDIVQEVFLKLCEQDRRILREFEPRGEDSFFGLLRVIAVSVANDHFRRLASVKRGGRVVTMSMIEGAPTAMTESTQQTDRLNQSVLLAQLDKKLRSAPESVAERDRNIFWFYYLQGMSAEEIAGLPEVDLSAKGVESALRRVSTWLRAEVRQGLPDG